MWNMCLFWPSHRNSYVQDRVRSGEGTSDEYFELGAIMLRKKYYVLANKYLEQAISKWEGDEQELAQVRLGRKCKVYAMSLM